MNTHADKAAETKRTSIANGSPTWQGNGRASSQFSDKRPEAAALMKIQELANHGPGVYQLRSLQELAPNSHQSKQATQFQALADSTAPLPIQRKRAEPASSGMLVAQLVPMPKRVNGLTHLVRLHGGFPLSARFPEK
jgi:hypothetical protein